MKTKKTKRLRHLLAATALGCLMGLSAASMAAAETATERWVETNSSGAFLGTGRVTFRNVRTELTGLYVMKQVENASLDYPAPEDDEFTFTVTLGGEPYGRAEYTLRDASGRKMVSFPEFYEQPQTQEFTFTVRVGGKLLSNEEYTVYDLSTGASTGTGKTDQKGTFTMLGGQRAVFRGLELDDYSVTEEDARGWRSVTGTTKEGALTSGTTVVTFSNVSASFGVSKEMKDGTMPEKEFTFLLTDLKQCH